MSNGTLLSPSAPRPVPVFLHIAVFVTMSIALPLYELLGQYPQFLVAHKASLLELVALTLVLSGGIALVLTSAVLLVRLIHPGLGRLTLYAVLAALTALFLLQLTNQVEALPPLLQFAITGLLGLVTAHLYYTRTSARSLLIALSPLIVVFPLWFIWQSPAVKEISPTQALPLGPTVAATTPVVLIIFDELPTTTLMAQDRSIDAETFPAFASLARHATWFRNATTVAASTLNALPAILTGRDPVSTHVPTYTDYPQNIFTLLGASYQMQVSEPITRLCPETLCTPSIPKDTAGDLLLLLKDTGVVFLHMVLPQAYAARLPSVEENWKGFGNTTGGLNAQAIGKDEPPDWAIIKKIREQAKGAIAATGSQDIAATFDRSLATLGTGEAPFLYVHHVPIPHPPWRYLPSGKQYRDLSSHGRTGGDTWIDEQPALMAQGFQRHLLQTAYVDSLLAKAIARLRSLHLYDAVLLIVTADHGATFKQGTRRRSPEAKNLADIAGIPLLVKLPHQQTGTVSDQWVNNTDILPTILDVLGIASPWPLQGRSVFADTEIEKPSLYLYSAHGKKYPFDPETFTSRDWVLDWKASLYGAGNTLGNLFAMGPGRAFVGQPLAHFNISAEDSLPGTLNYRHWFQNVAPTAAVLPARISGQTGTGSARRQTAVPQTLLIAINGQVVGTGETFSREGKLGLYSIMVPEEAFRAGFNLVEVFELASAETEPPVLRQVASSGY